MQTPPATATPVTLNREEQAFLGRVARTAIERGLSGLSVGIEDLPEPPTQALRRVMGAFVTLTRNGHLRGCIGNMSGREPLYLTVARMATAAAFEDPRFPALGRQEWPEVELDISVLGPLSRCPSPELVEIGRHGLLLARGGRSGVFLPQVPVEQGWDRLTYLNQLCVKAGLPPGSWKAPDAELYWYEAFVFTPPPEALSKAEEKEPSPC